jgi:hypothetical protein
MNFCSKKTQFIPKNDLLFFPCNIAKIFFPIKDYIKIYVGVLNPNNNNNNNKLKILNIGVGTHLDK